MIKNTSQLRRKMKRDCKVIYVRNADVSQKNLS